ncbi:hypothetical protein ACFFX0_24530 [Citricoccus parietis]|uniref:Uncharacterized protein n=1 Tax=Citricoccus parietis TaxID=592307 RepID=A0ABV5G6Y8_9MICC
MKCLLLVAGSDGTGVTPSIQRYVRIFLGMFRTGVLDMTSKQSNTRSRWPGVPGGEAEEHEHCSIGPDPHGRLRRIPPEPPWSFPLRGVPRHRSGGPGRSGRRLLRRPRDGSGGGLR